MRIKWVNFSYKKKNKKHYRLSELNKDICAGVLVNYLNDGGKEETKMLAVKVQGGIKVVEDMDPHVSDSIVGLIGLNIKEWNMTITLKCVTEFYGIT